MPNATLTRVAVSSDATSTTAATTVTATTTTTIATTLSHRDDRHHGTRVSPVDPRYRHARWVRGHRYDGPTQVVRNFGDYRLRPPTHGYCWVRTGNDFLLVAISTGIILDLALR